MQSWTKTTLGEFTTLQRGHDLPSQERKLGPVPILGSFGITGWHDEARVPGPGLTVGRSGASFGVVTYSSVDFWPLNTALFVKDFHGNDERFAYYFLKSLNFKAFNSGSAVQSLNRNHVHPIQVLIPPLPEQKAIAHILGTLDDKIELNRQTNKTLEAMARAIFKSWFVDFDPVHANRAKKSGDPGDTHKAALSLSPEILDLFPDSFQDSELGEIPVGWEVLPLKELTSKIGSGATPRGGAKVYQDTGVALIRSQNVYDSKFVWDGLARIDDDAAQALAGVSVEADDVLLNITGASILRTCIVVPDALPARVNQHVAIIRAKENVPANYLHLHCLNETTKSYLLGMDAGGSREAVTKGHIESVPTIKPSDSILAAFQNVSTPMYRAIERNEGEQRMLSTLRDTLLPKLISGELRIKDAEKFLKDAPL